MKRVCIVGIDSLDRIILERLLPELPNFQRLYKEGGVLPLRSVEPPDSVTAWSSIYTGMNPAEHGRVYFTDPLEKVEQTVNRIRDNESLVGHAIWDDIARAGGKSILVFPKDGFPAWTTSGIFLSRSEAPEVHIRADPPSYMAIVDEITKKHGLPHMNTLTGLPSSKKALREEIDHGERLVEAETDLTLRLVNEFEWDLLHVYSSVMDWVSHNTWMNYDKGDPGYPGPGNEFEDVIPDFYRRYDRMIGRIREALPSDTVFMVISDHGHDRRPTTLVNLNRVLKDLGLYKTRDEGKTGGRSGARLAQRVKKASVRFVNRHGWTWAIAQKAIHFAPGLRKFYTRPAGVDWENTTAYLMDQSGIKAYNYAGIALRPDLDAVARESALARIENALRELKHPTDGQPLVTSILRREELYQGEHMERYPDLVIRLREGFGAGHVSDGLIGESDTHNIQPGTHRRDTPVLVTSHPIGLEQKEIVELYDVTPALLRKLERTRAVVEAAKP